MFSKSFFDNYKLNLLKSEDITKFSFSDRYFAEFISRLDGQSEIAWITASLSESRRNGHICLDISEKPQWCEILQRSSVVGKPGEYKPLILDNQGRLYLYRYWEYQDKLARFILKRTQHSDSRNDLPQHPASGTQSDAAMTAFSKKFCVISGGPGTGKTFTVSEILKLFEAVPNIRIALAAPTGKAAARLQEAVGTTPLLRSAGVCTLHRLLGTIPGSPYFRFNANRLLPYDVVIVDEASMIDLALMSKLVQAMLPDSQLILLGDKDQLASVEAGAVLGDICDTGGRSGINNHPMYSCIVHLEKNYRFGHDSGIRAISQTLNSDSSGQKALSLLKSGDYQDIVFQQLPPPENLPGYLSPKIIKGFSPYLESLNHPQKALALFENFRVLCAVREGIYGVSGINRQIEAILRSMLLIRGDRRWYAGRPVMITGNDYTLKLFNGDIGIAMTDRNGLRVFFLSPDKTLRSFHPLRLPEHETAYAMTVHKSQGSEFAKVLMILPDKDTPILSKELIYTGITRARTELEIWSREDIFIAAAARRIQRMSGLRDALWAES